jgi:hypothetical protein
MLNHFVAQKEHVIWAKQLSSNVPVRVDTHDEPVIHLLYQLINNAFTCHESSTDCLDYLSTCLMECTRCYIGCIGAQLSEICAFKHTFVRVKIKRTRYKHWCNVCFVHAHSTYSSIIFTSGKYAHAHMHVCKHVLMHRPQVSRYARFVCILCTLCALLGAHVVCTADAALDGVSVCTLVV